MKSIVIALGLLLVATGARAADFSAPIRGIDDKPIADCPADKPQCGKVLTLGDVVATALFQPYPDERQTIGGEEKVRRAALAFRVLGAKELKLTAEETALIKKLIAKDYSPLIVFRAWRMLDPGQGDAAQ